MRWPGLDHTPWLGRLSGAELLRKTLHLGVGLLAFTLADLGWSGSCLLLLGLSVFNLWVWPHLGGRRLWRSEVGGHDVGIVLYPTVLLALLLITRRLDVVAAVWGLLALGDGSATLVGRAWGAERPLPWNPKKSWPGLFAHGFFGSLGAATLLVWTRWRLDFLAAEASGEGGSAFDLSVLHRADLGLAVTGAMLAAGVAAAVESLPLGLDDNVTAPPLATLVLLGWLDTGVFWPTLLGPEGLVVGRAALLALLIHGVLAWLAHRAGSIDGSGVVAGVLLGTVIATALGFAGFALLATFFVLGSLTTRVGWAAKVARGLAEGNRGRRGARNALANVSVPAALAFFALTTPHGELLTLGVAAAFAAATADTVSSELGQLWGRRPRMLTTFEPAAPGTDGAVSWEGTLAGLAGAAVLAVVAWVGGLLGPHGVALGWVVVAGFAGNLLDSLLGATLERRGLLDNEGVNFATTLGAALLAMACAAWWGWFTPGVYSP